MKKYFLDLRCFGNNFFRMHLSNFIKIFTILILLWTCNSSAISQAIIGGCKTYGGGIKSVGLLDPGICSTVPAGPFYIKIYIHVLRKPDGTLSQDETNINNAITFLKGHFSPHNVFFVWDCEILEIPVTDEEFVDQDLYCSLFQDAQWQYGNGISIFLGPDVTVDDGVAIAENIPSTQLFISGTPEFSQTPFIETPVISHEMGHCLGLWHTFHGTYPGSGNNTNCINFEPDPDQCCELVNETNGEICGDYVEDTNADHYLWQVNAQCGNFQHNNCGVNPAIVGQFTPCFSNPPNPNPGVDHCPWKDENEEVYSPLTNNIMSYVRLECFENFTSGQGERMRCIIDTEDIFESAQLPAPEVVVEGQANSIFCVGETVQVVYTICPPADCPAVNTTEVELTPVVPVNIELYVNFENDFSNGSATVTIGPNTTCATITLEVTTEPDFPVNDILSITMEAVPETQDCPQYLPGSLITEISPINCFACSCPPGGITIGAPGETTYLSQEPSIPNPLTGCAIIAGDLIVDIPSFTINAAEIFMEPGVRITADGGGNLVGLTIRGGSHLQGCPDMWAGITVRGNANLFIGENSIIEDATVAVFAESGATLDIQNTLFDRNGVGIAAEAPFGLSPLDGCTFDCTSSLSPPMSGQFSEAGVKLSDVGVIEIIGAFQPVLFQNLHNGIITQNCELTVRGAVFNDLRSGGGHIISGTGIHASGSGEILWLTGPQGNPPATFTNCVRGVEVVNMDAFIVRAEMFNVNYGIVAKKGTDRRLYIYKNDITASGIGIWLIDTDAAQMINVDNNDILVDKNLASKTPPVTGGVVVEENGVPQLNSTIQNNNIDIVDIKSGISLKNSEHTIVSCNNISALSPDYNGIHLNNCPNLQVLSNTVTETNSSIGGTPVSAGIKATLSSGVSYSCNNVVNTGIGVQFDMMCGDTKLKTTTFNSNTWGLHYLAGASTGQQPDLGGSGTPVAHGNRWVGDWNGRIGAILANPNQFNLLENRYTIPSVVSYPNSHPPNPSPFAGWFVEDPNINQLSCFVLLCKEVWGDRPSTELDESIADGTFTAGGDHEVSMRWMAEKFLYEKLLDNPSLIISGSVYETFYNAKDGSPLSALSNVKLSIENLFALDGSTTSQLAGLYDQRVAALDSISIIDSLLLTATGGAAEQLEIDKLVQLDELDSLTDTNRALVQSIKSDRNVGADGVLSQNATINTMEVYEQNEKLVNDLLLRSLGKGIALDSSQIAQLEAIASQCTYTGGPAVFRARGLLADKTDLVFDDGVACSPQGQQLVAPPTTEAGSANAGFRLFPNPAAESFTLEGLEKVDTDKQLTIIDINGRSVVGMQLRKGQAKASVQIGHLSPGIYLLKVMDGAEELFSKKLIVQ